MCAGNSPLSFGFALSRQLLLSRAAARLDEIEREASSPREALEAVACALLTAGRPTQEETRVWVGFLAAALGDPDIAEHHLNGNRALLRRLEGLIAAVRPDWVNEDAAALASQLAALCEGFNSASILDPVSYPRQMQEQAVKLPSALSALSALSAQGRVDGPEPRSTRRHWNVKVRPTSHRAVHQETSRRGREVRVRHRPGRGSRTAAPSTR